MKNKCVKAMSLYFKIKDIFVICFMFLFEINKNCKNLLRDDLLTVSYKSNVFLNHNVILNCNLNVVNIQTSYEIFIYVEDGISDPNLKAG